MKPILPTTVTAALTLTRPAAAIANWRVGQVLQAIAVTGGHQGRAQLRIGAHTVEAQTRVPLRPGQPLRLEVTELGPRPTLRILADPVNDPVTAAVRRAVPRQQSPGALLSTLSEAVRPDSSQPLPEPVRTLAARVAAQAAEPEALARPGGLRQAVARSGLFLEAQLARTEPDESALRVDGKANLLRLLETLRNWPGLARRPGRSPPPRRPREAPAAAPRADPPPLRGNVPRPPPPLPTGPPPFADPAETAAHLQHQTEAALARLTLNQLASLPRHRHEAPEWALDLPVRNPAGQVDIWPLRIRRDPPEQSRQQGTPGTERWSVTLAFDLPGLGPVQVRLQLQGEAVSARFWAEQPATHERFTRHLEELRERLGEARLVVGQLSCHQGSPPGPPAAAHTLLDDKA